MKTSLFITSLALAACIIFFAHSTQAATLYWYKTGANDDWATLTGNWWNDSAHNSSADVLPAAGDDAVLLGGDAPVVNVDSWDQPTSIDSTGLTGVAKVNGVRIICSSESMILSSINGNVTFDNCLGAPTINGSAIFNGLSSSGGDISGTAIFNDLSYNLASNINDGIFNDSSYNGEYGVVGSSTFNDTSYNLGTITGDATFNTTYYDPIVPSEGVFTISSNVLSGSVSGVLYGSDHQRITEYIFKGSNFNSGTLMGNATFNDTSYNLGTITGDATFNTTYYDPIVPSEGVFTISSHNWSGSVSGTVYGSDHAAITSYIFNDTSYNLGTITGDATFNTTYYDPVVPSEGVFTISSHNWSGSVSGTVYGSDHAAITSYIFNGSSTNSGILNESAVFNGASMNLGTVNGDAIFNDTSLDNQFTGRVTGNAVFNNSMSSLMDSMVLFGTSSSKTTYVNEPISFSFKLFDHSGAACSQCTFSVATVPSVTVNFDKVENTVTGSFIPTRLGTYSLSVIMNDGNYTVTNNDLLFSLAQGSTVSSSTVRYYFRERVPTHGQPLGNGSDSGTLSMSPPEVDEVRSCGSWVQYSLDELPSGVPINSLISDINLHFQYVAAGHGVETYIGEQRYVSYNAVVDQKGILPLASVYTWIDQAFLGNWPVTSGSGWYRSAIKLQGSGAHFYSAVVEPSFADYTFQYTTLPLVRAGESNSADIMVLSATASITSTTTLSIVVKNSSSSATSTELEFPGIRRPFLNTVSIVDSSGTTTVLANVSANATSSFDSIDMDVTPSFGSISFTIDDWSVQGDYSKIWAETGSDHDISAVHVVGGNKVRTHYDLKVNGAIYGSYISNSDGQIEFIYNGGYSTNTFQLLEDLTLYTPTVVTVDADSVSTSTLTMNAVIAAAGGVDVTALGFTYGTSSDLSVETSTSTFDAQVDEVSFSETLTNLIPETRYYFRAYAVNSVGTSTGSILSTTTLALPVVPEPPVLAPSILDYPATSITQTAAILNGSTTITGGANLSKRGFEYGRTTAYGTVASTTGNYSVGSFSIDITGLSCDTKYYFRAFATNTAGTAHSDGSFIMTSSCTATDPVVVTPQPTPSSSGSHSGGRASLSTLIALGLVTPEGEDLTIVPGCSAGYICKPKTTVNIQYPITNIQQTTPTTQFTPGIIHSTLKRDLQIGMTGADVKFLQQYLNAQGYIVATSGAGSPSRETTTFGALTKKALAKYQKDHGIPSTGYFGPKTRAFVGK